MIRRTRVEVDLGAVVRNARTIRGIAGTDVIAVVKADAYGHGAVAVAQALERAKAAAGFAVSLVEEGVTLREAGVVSPILVMGPSQHGGADEMVEQKLTPVVSSADDLAALVDTVKRRGESAPIDAHLKVDTGMGRLGVSLDALPQILAALKISPHLSLEGLSTHLASSEVLDEPSLDAQLKAFEQARVTIHNAGFNPAIVHVANSCAILSRPQTWNDMVRPGIALYGAAFSLQKEGCDLPAVLDLKPVLSWKTHILSLREMPAGQALGYNGTYVTKAPSRIAVLPVGYADGLNRRLSSRGRVLVRGAYAPIVGRVSMDLTMIDVTAAPAAAVGDEVILIGNSGNLQITASEQATLAGTISYEILCAISKRVPRKYIQ
jgi:alanine racemase